MCVYMRTLFDNSPSLSFLFVFSSLIIKICFENYDITLLCIVFSFFSFSWFLIQIVFKPTPQQLPVFIFPRLSFRFFQFRFVDAVGYFTTKLVPVYQFVSATAFCSSITILISFSKQCYARVYCMIIIYN